MTEIALPNTDDIAFEQLRLSAPAQVNRSQWTGRRKVVGGPGRETWTGKATVETLTTEDQERPWRVFLFSLDGPVNSFRWPLPWNLHIGPKPVVGSSPGNGYTLPLTGMQPNTRIAKAGQFMTVPLPSGHARAILLTADLVTNGSGNATATFRPALGEVPTVGATVESAKPYIPMSLTDGDQGFNLSGAVSGASFDVEEAR